MKITIKLILLYSILIVVTIGITSYVTFQFFESSIVEREIEEMTATIQAKEIEIETLHKRASEDLVFALKNPLFVEYFELPETKAGNVYEEDVLQFTENQQQVKKELEEWIWNFQNKFQVDETCIIDTAGQEHARLVLQLIAIDEELSPDEEFAPFFEPTFKKSQDEVHIQYPYVSPDTNRWVFAYASPVVLGNEEKPAFYHFEMPITIFQDIVNIEHGRMYVIDPDGFIIADSYDDSVANARYNVDATTINSFVPSEYFPSVKTVSASSGFETLFNNIVSQKDGYGSYSINGDAHHVVYTELPTFGWILAYEKPQSLMISKHNTVLGDMKLTIISIQIIITVAALFSVFVISRQITRPLIKFIDATKNIADGALDTKINIRGSDELHELSESFNKMTGSLKKKVELEKNLAVAEQKIKDEKLTSIGFLASRLAHDIRNPLTVIKATLDIMKKTNPQLNKKNQEQFQRVENSIVRIDHQIENVLGFVRTMPLKLTQASLFEIINLAIENVEMPENVKIEKEGNDIKINCDAKLIEIVFVNLIINSIQAMKEFGIIKIRLIDQVNQVMIEVEDSGPGISEDEISKVFEPLFTTKQEGTGLGLSSCKNIIEQHGGIISVYNNPTRFVIKLQKDPKLIKEIL